MPHARTISISTAILVIVLSMLSRTEANELVLPDNLFYYQSVASVWDNSAVWNNPAAISLSQSGQMWMFTHRDGRAIRDWGTVTVLKHIGVGYRHIKGGQERDLNEYVFALSTGNRLSIGISYRYFKDAPGQLNKRHLWTLGFVSRQNRNLVYGARFENLNRGEYNGEQSDYRIVFGASARIYRDLVTSTIEFDMTQHESFHQAGIRTGIEVRPKPGLNIFADFDNQSRINIGLRLNFGKSFVGHYHNFDRNMKSILGTSYIGITRKKQPSLTKAKHQTLVIKLNGSLPENPKIAMFKKKPLRFFDFIDGIYKAADDDAVDRLFLQINRLRCGMAKVEELSEAIKYFRRNGKKVTAYLSRSNNLGYLVASNADRIIVPPVSELPLIGLRAELQTYKGLLDKIGIEVELERVDEYKTAAEPFIFDRPSEPNREQINRILDNLYDQLLSEVAFNRQMTIDSVKNLIDMAPFTSIEAKNAGLVDTTLYLDEALRAYGSLPGGKLNLTEFLFHPAFSDRWGNPPKLAVIIADGGITEGKNGGKIGEYEMLSSIRRAGDDNDVKGILLRVNSPGGSALASDLIWHEIDKTAKKKPLIISMGNVAASGGYYISAVNNPVFVNRSTITGSIGVFAGKYNLSRLYDKIGIYSESHLRGRNAGIYSNSEPYTPEQRKKLRSQIKALYRHFVDLVAASRDLSSDSVDALGRGQVWTGSEAVRLGLADDIGGYYRALLELRLECDISEDFMEIVSYPRKYYFFKNPFKLPKYMTDLARIFLGEEKNIIDPEYIATGQIYFRMPYNISIE